MAETSPYYITKAMLENRISTPVMLRVFDDANIGAVATDDAKVLQVIQDAEAHFESYARNVYALSTLRVVNPPREATRLCLDVAEALTCRRFPKAASREWQPLWAAVEKELMNLRAGKTRLDVDGSPEPAANQGGEYYQEGETSGSGDQPPSFTYDGYGDF